jgi:hypothetical protein
VKPRFSARYASTSKSVARRRREVRRLLRDCAAKHKAISHFFGSDAGVRLMREDSDLANAVMLAMQREEITALGVHDSFIAPSQRPQTRASDARLACETRPEADRANPGVRKGQFSTRSKG